MKGRKAVTADSILMCGSVRALINRGEPAKACVTSRKNNVCMNVCVQARVCHRFCFLFLLNNKNVLSFLYLLISVLFPFSVTSICSRLK